MIISNYSFGSTPICNGTYWEIDKYQILTKRGDCKGKIAVCLNIGTKGEGWYSYPKAKQKFLKYDFCAYDPYENYLPVCDMIGTKGEGWYANGKLLKWDNCAKEEAKCLYKNTENEGWYTFPKDTKKIILWDKCSEIL